MIARKRQVLILKRTHQPAVVEVDADIVLQQIGDAYSVARRPQSQRDVVDDHLPRDADIKRATVLLEIPGVEAATAG